MAWIAPKAHRRKVVPGPRAASLQRLAIVECALGAKAQSRAPWGPWRARDLSLSREESASAYQHDNDHDDQDKYKCSSSNEHGYFFLSLGGCRVSESAVRAGSTLGLGSVSGSIGTV